MKTLMLAAAGALISTAAFAQGAGGVVLTNPEFGTGFSNRGQCVSTLAKVRNSQRANPATRGPLLLAGLRIAGEVPPGAVLLIDDVTRSGWTLTAAAALLREAGAGRVLPLVLRAERS